MVAKIGAAKHYRIKLPPYGCGKLPHEAHMKTCPDCNGDGVVERGTDDEQQCPTCGGRGFVPDDDDDHEDVIKTSPISGAS